MMREELIEAVASRRAREIEREQEGIRAEVEAQPYKDRTVIRLTRDGTPSGTEFIETEASVHHPAADKEYLRLLRDDLYLGIVVPRLPPDLEKDLVVRLRALREHVRNEGYATTNDPALFVYDHLGKVERRAIRSLE